MSYRERIAFAMFKTSYPENIAAQMSLESMPVTRTRIDARLVQEVDTGLDWGKKRDRYLKLADAALLEIDALAHEADQNRQGRNR